ncbi:MAG: Aryl-alcohol dehydrogenase [Candidatus Omnitrophica bacterium]|nr:Aryl-alcohol dehydrogenase [Candidatus Omnitrophota bacterium]
MSGPHRTQAAVLERTGRPLAVRPVEVPAPGRGQALVRIAYSGVCGSQLNEARGRKGKDPYLPHTLGHEGSGVVIGIGPGVTKVRPGDHVVLTWIKGQGLEGRTQAYRDLKGRRINTGPVSTLLGTALISENRLVRIRKNMPLKEAALLGCAVPTGAGIVRHQVRPLKKQTVAVFGCGGVGLAAVLALAASGARPVAVDVVPARLRAAKAAGSWRTLDASRRDPAATLLRLTGAGCDACIECSGNTGAMESALASVRPGGVCVIAGNPPRGSRMAVDPFELIRGKRLVGSWGGSTDPDRDIPRYVEEFLSGRLRLGMLLGRTMPLSRVNEALDGLESGAVRRTLVEM